MVTQGEVVTSPRGGSFALPNGILGSVDLVARNVDFVSHSEDLVGERKNMEDLSLLLRKNRA